MIKEIIAVIEEAHPDVPVIMQFGNNDQITSYHVQPEDVTGEDNVTY